MQQTYPSKSLLIVSDGEDVRDLIPNDNHCIRHVHMEQRNVGDKRNFGCSLALGSIIAIWDDDDYSAPGRLTDQIERMQATGCAVTGYHSMRFTDGARWWQYRRGVEDYSLGTALCFRKDWWAAHPFPPIAVCEDVAFVEEARRDGVLVSVDAGDLMHATIHAQNTSPRETAFAQWTAL